MKGLWKSSFREGILKKKRFSPKEMAICLAGLVTIAIVIASSFTVDTENSMQRVRRDDDDDDRSRSEVLLCPCSQGCCDENWYQYKDACYFPVHVSKSWQQAKQNCEDLNAHLASVHSENEDSFIFYLMWKRTDYWLGAEKTDDTAAPWKWIDNSAMDYPDKLPNQVAAQQYDRLTVRAGKTSWTASKQSSPHKYVCKYLLD
ncbi:snaclec agkisacutacin subunit B-like isoform X2 [Sceloporus undulatus]|uniref:snaclec agkisacutacin subunit B-like isoform X2 n=1 Tax=Sceloporus undulatus TaxID=8520 RepID=UPI001C4C4D69|nr:snaclec agkisacutacin subunit B-like isoform X2 [Sceloporus undulatus]